MSAKINFVLFNKQNIWSLCENNIVNKNVKN